MTTEEPITALRYDEPSFAGDLAAWCRGEVVVEPDPLDATRDPHAIRVPLTQGGSMLAWVGDWVVRSPTGSFTVVANERFVAQHEPLA